MGKMTELVKAARDLAFFRGVAGKFEPLEIEHASQADYHQMRDDYRDWIDQHWNHPDAWFVELIPDLFKRSEYGKLEMQLGGYWDNWDGAPTELVTSEDIERLRKELDISIAEYGKYFSLNSAEKESARNDYYDEFYGPLFSLLDNRE